MAEESVARVPSLGQRIRNIPPILISLAILVFFLILFQSRNAEFLSLYNIKNMGESAAVLITVGIGQCWTIVTGGIDLSVGGLISLTSVVFISLVGKLGYWAYAVCLVIGAVAGLLNGLLLTRVKIPSFVVTLGTGGIFVSISYLVTPKAISTPPAAMGIMKIVTGTTYDIKNAFIVAFVFFIIFLAIQYLTKIGRNIFYVGTNVKMSWLSGVNVANIKTVAFMFSGIGAATAGLILAAKQYSGFPTIGSPYILQSIAAVVLGGTAMTGGSGGVLNTLIGAILMSVLQNGMTVVGIDVYMQQSLLGAMIIVCVWLAFDRSKVDIIK